MNFQPLLAYKLKDNDIDNLTYPIYVQRKLDGIRCIVINGQVYSRQMKLIPNRWIRKTLHELLEGFTDIYFDGELMLREPINATYQQINSAVMSHDGSPPFVYRIFDCYIEPNVSYSKRYIVLANNLPMGSNYITLETSFLLQDRSRVLEYEEVAITNGEEGIVLRSPIGIYKFGRSTLNEQYLMALKRFEDAECKIIGFEPFYHNGNKLEQNELGYAKRSSSQDNLIELPKLGALKVVGTNGDFEDVEFKIGSGFEEYQRELYWSTRKELLHKIGKYKFQKIGSKDKPRCPVWLGFREE